MRRYSKNWYKKNGYSKMKLCQHKQKKMLQILNVNHRMMLEVNFLLHLTTKHSLSMRFSCIMATFTFYSLGGGFIYQ